MKHVLISGCTRGIGAACVKKFLMNDWVVTGMGRSEENPFHDYSSIFHYVQGDLSSTKDRKRFVMEAFYAFGKIDALVNVAGVAPLERKDLLEMTEEKGLIVGLAGEKLLKSFRFYAVFKDSEDYTVRCGSDEIGTITTPPPVGDRFALAGRVWEVEEVDVGRRLVYAKKVEGKMKISWPGDSGFIHTRILEKMREILESDEEYSYLLPEAKIRLKKVRSLAKNTGFCQKSILNLGGNSFVFFPWLGTKAFQTMKRILQRHLAQSCGLYDIQSGGCYYITFKTDKTCPTDILSALYELNENNEPSLLSLVGTTEYPVFDKYDACLPQKMLIQAYAENRLDLQEVQYRISTLSKEL